MMDLHHITTAPSYSSSSSSSSSTSPSPPPSDPDHLISQTRRLSLSLSHSPLEPETGLGPGPDPDPHQHAAAAEETCLLGHAQPEAPRRPPLERLPNELLLHILTFLDIPDLLTATRLNRHLRALSTTPTLHAHRLRQTRLLLPPSLDARPSLADLMQRRIFLTPTTIVSKRLARSLVSIRLARKLSSRPEPQDLVRRAVLPQECVPRTEGRWEAPAIVQRKKVIERERIKDGLRSWLERRWMGERGRRENEVWRWQQEGGVGRVWRLTRFWEGIGRASGIGVR